MAKLKVCGITRREDLEVCDALGVDAVGINLWTGSKRGLGVPEAAALLEGARGAQRVGVFVDFTPAQVAEAAATLHLDAIQPHGDAPPEGFAALGLPWIWVVRGTPDLETLRVPTPAPAWVLLDAAVPGYGGAGKTTDWTWASAAVEALAPLPVWLAGGITPDNAAAALLQVRPAGLDVASGAESVGATRGQKDRGRIEALLEATRAPGAGPGAG
ncbi:MAG: phosphoribosylanthranilate isomerase [Myxococcota bacterium]